MPSTGVSAPPGLDSYEVLNVLPCPTRTPQKHSKAKFIGGSEVDLHIDVLQGQQVKHQR